MRSWLVIPAMGAIAALAVLALRSTPVDAIAAAAAGAALAGAIRALAGDAAAALTGAVVGSLLAIALIEEHGGHLLQPCAALAGIAWTAAELARPSGRAWIALVPASVAAVAAPAATPLIAIAGARLVAAQQPRPRWALVAPLAGVIAIAIAIAVGAARHSSLASLWYGAAPHRIGVGALAARAAEALGPIAAVAALAGAASLARALAGAGSLRPSARTPGRLAELAVAACIAGALLSDLRAGAIGPVTLGLAALCAGLAVGRFAGQIRLPAGQAFAGATVGLLLLLPPAWTAAATGLRSNPDLRTGPPDVPRRSDR